MTRRGLVRKLPTKIFIMTEWMNNCTIINLFPSSFLHTFSFLSPFLIPFFASFNCLLISQSSSLSSFLLSPSLYSCTCLFFLLFVYLHIHSFIHLVHYPPLYSYTSLFLPLFIYLIIPPFIHLPYYSSLYSYTYLLFILFIYLLTLSPDSSFH